MKIKFLTLLAASLFLFSCSTEETNETNNDDVNFSVNTDSIGNESGNSDALNLSDGNDFNGESGGGSMGGGAWNFPCTEKPCNPNYVFPTPDPAKMYRNIYVIYDPNEVPLDKIACVRQEYFECFTLMELVFPAMQSNDPYEELWQVEAGKPDQGLDTTICNDPRTNTTCED